MKLSSRVYYFSFFRSTDLASTVRRREDSPTSSSLLDHWNVVGVSFCSEWSCLFGLSASNFANSENIVVEIPLRRALHL